MIYPFCNRRPADTHNHFTAEIFDRTPEKFGSYGKTKPQGQQIEILPQFSSQ